MTEAERANIALALTAFDTLFNKRDYVAAEHYWSSNYATTLPGPTAAGPDIAAELARFRDAAQAALD